VEHPVMEVRLGAPRMPFGVKKGVYYRFYERGLVVLNPHASSATVTFRVPWSRLVTPKGRVFKPLRGTLVLTVAGRSGMVLLAKEGP